MSLFTFRHIEKRDFLPSLELMKNEMGQEYSNEFSEEFEQCLLRKKYFATVCFTIDGEFVGFISWRKQVEVAYIETIMIVDLYQGKGVGSQLLHIAETEICENNISHVNVVTDAHDNNDVIQFYVKNGFQISGEVDHECIPNIRQIHLCKLISNKE